MRPKKLPRLLADAPRLLQNYDRGKITAIGLRIQYRLAAQCGKPADFPPHPLENKAEKK
jgi:hypothetical protein